MHIPYFEYYPDNRKSKTLAKQNMLYILLIYNINNRINVIYIDQIC